MQNIVAMQEDARATMQDTVAKQATASVSVSLQDAAIGDMIDAAEVARQEDDHVAKQEDDHTAARHIAASVAGKPQEDAG